MRHHRLALALLTASLLATACGGAGDGDGGGNGNAKPPTSTDTGTNTGLSAATASYDLAVGPTARFILGVFNPNRGPVGYGTIKLAFAHLGTPKPGEEVTPQPGPEATAGYLPLPGSALPPADATKPVFLPETERGVYAAEVAFDKPGFWEVSATIPFAEGDETVKSSFAVLAEHEVPAVGDAALAVENLTMANPGPRPEAVDSRARDGAAVPDPQLHQDTVAAAMAAGRPVLLSISTPTFCFSKFCGPVTDMVGELAAAYPDRAAYVHIEVWEDFVAKKLNPAAAEWIAKGEKWTEPWVFLIGADGKVAARWDNVATRGEIEPLLQALPAT